MTGCAARKAPVMFTMYTIHTRIAWSEYRFKMKTAHIIR